jgi:uncharacterized membrane protein YhaH (DUF805 family)
LSGIINLIFLGVRRLNDFNYSGWWMFLVLIPLIGLILFLILAFIPGTNHRNKYGASQPVLKTKNYLFILSAPLLYFILYLSGFYN